MSNYRKEKLSELYRRAATSFIQERIHFENSIFSVTKVELTEKLSRLKVYYSIWPDQKESNVVKSLEELKLGLRKDLAQRIKVKFVPKIEFHLDDSEKKRLRIEELLKEDK